MQTKIIKQIMFTTAVVLGYYQANAQLVHKIDMTEDGQLIGLGTKHIFKSKDC